MPRLGTENAFSILGKAKRFEDEVLKPRGQNLIYLQIGEPDFNTPENIKAATLAAIKENRTHYTPTPGIPELRGAVAGITKNYTGVDYQPADVVITAGAKPIIFYMLNALLDEGDEVLIPNPAFPIYGSVTEYLGAKIIPLQLKEEKDFNLDLAELEKKITPKTKLLILNSPQNPTGADFGEKLIRETARLARQNDLWVLSDEIYHQIIHQGRHFSIASGSGMAERTVILNGVSKTYAMTGYRIGWGVTKNKEMAAVLERFACNDISCPNSIAQQAALEAITGPQTPVQEMLEAYRKRRDLLVELVNKIPGMSCYPPAGAFYLMVNVQKILERLNISLEEFCDHLMREACVLVLPGTVFGHFGENFIRFSYVSSEENIRQGMRQIKEYLDSVLK
jgi:aspartate/methionine/tyrosine aminotransferase